MTASTLRLQDGAWSFTLDAERELSFTASAVEKFVAAVTQLHAVVPLEKLDAKPIGPAETCRFEYEFTLVDGRSWRQVLVCLPGAEAAMTFDVDDEFKVSEFSTHREVRDRVVELLKTNGVTRIKVRQGSD